MTSQLTEVDVCPQKIRDQFVTALGQRRTPHHEYRWGSSNYWLYEATLLRSDVKPTGHPWYADARVFEGPFEAELQFDLKYDGDGAGRKRITDADVQRGLEVMARDHPRHFRDMMDDGSDPDVADMFAQILVHGKVVYGCEAPKHCPYSPAMLEWMDKVIADGKKIVAAAQAKK